MDKEWILPLDAGGAQLEAVGGKGANLARLMAAGFSVPGGFLVTTSAYEAFVAANDLRRRVSVLAETVAVDDLAALEAVSAEIRAGFARGTMPPALAESLQDAYRQLGQPPVAVRSSATAEDLPDFSFAGQQDTFLNVIGEDALLRAVVDCWSSLWTARAIGYRKRNAVSTGGLALGVVVQQMVNSEVSGVLFTANPLTGDRTEVVIDATWGLGEALVSGQVEPDHYVVAAGTLILQKAVGAKAVMIRPADTGGVVSLEAGLSHQQALPDPVILELAQLGRKIAVLYGVPQDVEWAWAEGKLFVLQARPITSLYPLPDGLPENPLAVLISFGAVQGMLDPMTPLGRQWIQSCIPVIARRFGMKKDLKTQTVLVESAERMFMNLTPVAHNKVGRKLMRAAMGAVEPAARAGLELLWDDPRLAHPGPLRFRSVGALVRGMGPVFVRVIGNLLRPESMRPRVDKRVEAMLADFAQRSAAAASLADRLTLFQVIWESIPGIILGELLPGMVAGMAMFVALMKLAEAVPGGDLEVLAVTRGMPGNVTTEMDLALWVTARQIQSDPAVKAFFLQTPAEQLAADWMAGTLPSMAHSAIQAFMDRYGMRGLAEIDLGRPRWREEPVPVFQSLQSYLQITDPELAPDAVFSRGAVAAEAALTYLVTALRSRPGGWLKARLARAAGRRVRLLLGIRESPKFFVIRLMGMLRMALLESGRDLVSRGILQAPDDLFFLGFAELQSLADHEPGEWRALVDQRRAVYQRELRRRQIPRVLLGDGRAIFEGLSADAEAAGVGELVGSPVSPGVVEGGVHVVLDPRGVQLIPGEILVCPGTDPSWTPLFLSAGGLVMEVGGLMTHGAVVAREYGIPAVVGVHDATTRLQTGQRIRVDGATGKIVILA